ncbi:phospholipase D-like domain-containing protein [Massilia jejuensis]|uniref:Phospholipase D-like domain-containing protein n=1 Tax=Massilia jejuensis TaxID=648894 RepID=A0ABW0PFL3_9BURK
MLSDDPRIPLKTLMGRMVTISLVREDGSLRYFNGYITECRFVRCDGGFASTTKRLTAPSATKAIGDKTKMPITAEALADRGIKALMGSMWSGAAQPKSTKDYEETYIHAKVAIVDDAAFTVGSVNLNVRSMALDSELNLLSQAMDVAFDLRKKLFKQCTNDEGPAQFGNMKKTFEAWLDLMNDNTEAMASGLPLSGQIATFHVDRQPGSPVI